jgi:hypothetical protein
VSKAIPLGKEPKKTPAGEKMTEQFHLFWKELNSPVPSKKDGSVSNSNSSLFDCDEIVPGVIFSQAEKQSCL